LFIKIGSGYNALNTGPQLDGTKNFKRAKHIFGGQKYTKYNNINNNSENFSGVRLLLGRQCPLSPQLPGLP